MRTRARSRGAGSGSGLSGMLRSRRAEEAAGGWGSEARLCAGGGGRTPESRPPRPPQDPPPSARGALSRAAAESGRWGGGGIPEGIPSPPPAAWRPGTHVSARPAPIPPAAQRILAPHPCLRRPGPLTSTALSLAGPRCRGRALGGAPAPASGRSVQAEAPLQTRVQGPLFPADRQ